MNILVIGSGGREHALVWKIKQSRKAKKIYCAPGNAGIGQLAELVAVKPTDLDGLLKFAKTKKIDLTVVGPEVPLTEGVVDAFEQHGMAIFGPSKSAAALEGSKVFAKKFMQNHGIPTSGYRTFEASQRFEAQRYIHELPTPIVIKTDGLAAGKGVLICETRERAIEELDNILLHQAFGPAGNRVVIEEFLVGEEASVFAITDGTDFVLLASAQDHKRILDDDQGKNTGGMGAYAPAPVMTEKVLNEVREEIIKPTIEGMEKEGRKYKGCLYCGLMMTESGAKVLEYNCRFGDPETQVVVPLIDGEFVDLLLAASRGDLSSGQIRQHDATAVCVVMASGGYPDEYETGKEISGLDRINEQEEGIVVFHAGTKADSGKVLTAGGRVLGVTAIGYANDLAGTITNAYKAVEKITFDGAYYRGDIGKKGLAKLLQSSHRPTAR
jgi:phosphoribosylamine--glycine ligase